MSTLVIDTIQGKTTAGSINVRGEGSNNTNLQQGLLKAWHRAEGDISTVAYNDSFNFASITDNGTGNYTSTLSNAMNNANYSISVESDMGGGNGGFNLSFTNKQFNLFTKIRISKLIFQALELHFFEF